MTKRETRSFQGVELRADSAGRKIEGYAAVFNVRSDIAGMFDEEILPGAFRRAITRDDVRALVNHDDNLVLGRNRAGTLRLAEDSTGLHIEVTPPDTTTARDLLISMERGDIDQMSFAFVSDMETWDFTGEPVLRQLEDLQLYDVSVVTYPQYPETSAAVRKMEARRAEMTPTQVPFNGIHQVRTRLHIRQTALERGINLSRD